ncbi:MAG: hypothetical protein IPK71_10570 [Myxococcales bacterium]|nr:hypothetical protein [Myxococcales bacterium]
MSFRTLTSSAFAFACLAVAACGTIAAEPDGGASDSGGPAPLPDAATTSRDSSVPDATDGSGPDTSPSDAAARERTCETEAIVRFENCVMTTGDAGRPATPQVIVESRIAAGANGPTVCAVAEQSWLTIGSYASTAGTNFHRPVRDGETEGGDRVGVSCSVLPEADGSFRISAEATRERSGTVRVSGIFRQENAPQTGIQVVFERPDLGKFAQSDCVASYDANVVAGVFPGRAWFRVTCPRAVSPGAP